ncbi:MAG: Eco57I restriction-modification methylase domain-containing protein [Acidobacteriota bacterium]
MSAFPSIRIEGGLLGPDILEELSAGSLPGQRPTDFGLDSKRNLTDEIAAAFADATAIWGVFKHRIERLAEDDPATTVTRDAWMIPFLGLLGYELRYNQRAYTVDGASFAISHRAGEPDGAPPVHIVGVRLKLGAVPPSGRPRLAAHSLVQQYLNRAEPVWGIVTNGETLRLLRDSTFVRRQAYVEFDIKGILEEHRFQDFAAFYRLLHRTRLPHGHDDADKCLLEQYYNQSIEQGGRVREHLRDGVEECLKDLANGFLRHPDNGDLRRRVALPAGAVDRITPECLYRQLLQLVYRFLFLLVSEDRGLLSTDPIYREHYGVARLRRLLDKRPAYTEHDDLWQSLRVLWTVLGDEKLAPFLQLAPLNGDLFAPQGLDGFTITNRDLIQAFRRLCWYQESAGAPPRRVNYAALDVEELGSVYESLLEYHPAVDPDGSGRPVFNLVFGSERKKTGSYYTPPQLVHELIQSALAPVVREKLSVAPNQREKALLSIRVCDPACGSGHFLLAAARTLGKELARLRTNEDEPAPEHVRSGIRDVISHCIYGVDKNPLAVDLCRVALWLESHTGDKPLTFLDHRIRVGDSLVGVFDLATLKNGIPDKAFEPLEGDNKAIARELARRNREERTGQTGFAWDPEKTLVKFSSQNRELDVIADDSPESIRRKKQQFERSHADPAWYRQNQACNLWTAAFFQPLQEGAPAITSGELADHLSGRPIDGRLLGLADALASRNRFFHWPLEFPEVFADGGFDVVLSNPPWERVKLQEQEFFAARDARIANASTKAARARMIRELSDTNPELHAGFIEALRAAGAASAFMRHSGRFPLGGRGDINTYAVFVELASVLTSSEGRAGLIVPTGIATDDTTKALFGSFVKTRRLVDLVGFHNEEFIFPAVDHRVTFCKITLAGTERPVDQTRIAFFVRRFSQLGEAHRFYALKRDDFRLLNPNTGNCPVSRSGADAELTKAIYRRVPILWRETSEDGPEANPWRLSFKRLFDMANDSHHFRTAPDLEAEGYCLEGNIFVGPHERYLPLYEAKMLHQFDHRFSTYEGATENQLNVGILPHPTAIQKADPSFVVQPRYWVREEVVDSAIPKCPEPLALALQVEDRASVQRVLSYWVAGYDFNRGNRDAAHKHLLASFRFEWNHLVARCFGAGQAEDHAATLERDFPLTESDISDIKRHLDAPEDLARQLVARFSPKWFLGWRDICRSTDERTIISSVCPKVPVGHTFPLAFCPGIRPSMLVLLIANLSSFVADYAARQKVGGTHITYNLLKQFALLSPECWLSKSDALEWYLARSLELIYTAHDLGQFACDCGYDGPPFPWDDARRFEIRCELDAAFFHLYFPSEADGAWRRAENETPEQLAGLIRHFPTPRHAVEHIMEQFPIVKDRDEKAHGRYRTKERILEIYDEMLAAQRSGNPYQSKLNPPPGCNRSDTPAGNCS